MLEHATTLLVEREAMSTSERDSEKGTEQAAESKHCEEEWCGGPQSESLPCFECFDRTREYKIRSKRDERDR